jgi:hypothetical protein
VLPLATPTPVDPTAPSAPVVSPPGGSTPAVVGTTTSVSASGDDGTWPHESRAKKGFKGDFIAIFAWSMGYPVGAVNGFIDEYSFRGMEIEGRYFLTNRISVGAGMGWNLYMMTAPRTTYELNSTAITTTLYRSLETFALRESVHYYFMDRLPFMPYAGLTVGGADAYFQVLAADLGVGDSGWNFLIGPEVGVLAGLGASGTGSERHHRPHRCRPRLLQCERRGERGLPSARKGPTTGSQQEPSGRGASLCLAASARGFAFYAHGGLGTTSRGLSGHRQRAGR